MAGRKEDGFGINSLGRDNDTFRLFDIRNNDTVQSRMLYVLRVTRFRGSGTWAFRASEVQKLGRWWVSEGSHVTLGRFPLLRSLFVGPFFGDNDSSQQPARTSIARSPRLTLERLYTHNTISKQPDSSVVT